MKLVDVQGLLTAEVVAGMAWMEKEAGSVCGADLMSDVLAFTKERTLLLTGLTNLQVIRTAEISDLVAIVFVRGKRPNCDLIQLAEEKGIPLWYVNCRCMKPAEFCITMVCLAVHGKVTNSGK